MTAVDLDNPFNLEPIKLICQHTDPQILTNYFHCRRLLLDVDLALLKQQQANNADYCQLVINLIKTLIDNDKALVLADFYKVSFFINNQTESFAVLLRYLTEVAKKDISLLANFASLYDKLVTILITFSEEFYQCYYFRYQSGLDKRLWTIRKDYYNAAVILDKKLLLTRLKTLEQQIRQLFKQELRGNGLDSSITEFEHKTYLCYYLENYPQLLAVFELGELKQKNIYPVFNINIVIDHYLQAITIYADCREKQRQLHLMVAKTIFNKTVEKYPRDGEFFDPQLLLKQLIMEKSFKPIIKSGSMVHDIYINKITLINLFEDYSEITLDTKQTKQKRVGSNGVDAIYNLLKDQQNIENQAKYLAKSIEFIALIINATGNSNETHLLTKHFIINKQGQTSLGLEEVDEQLKDCLSEFSSLDPPTILPLPFKAFMLKLFSRFEHNLTTEISLSPQDIATLSIEQLTALETAYFIAKYKQPKFGWCHLCDLYGDISYKTLPNPVFYCSGCNDYDLLNTANSVQYFSKINLLAVFLQVNLNLSANIETIIDDRLIYLGSKERSKYYLLIAINRADVATILKNIVGNYPAYIFCLANNHYLKSPKSIELFNLIENLVIVDGNLKLALPELTYQSSIARLGGIARSNKRFGEARVFVKQLFKEKLVLNPAKKKKVILLEIVQELQKRADLMVNLSDENLLDWVSKQLRKLK